MNFTRWSPSNVGAHALLATTLMFALQPVGAARAGDNGECTGGESYNSTFDAVQHLIFDRRSCSTDICHGASQSGGLDLRAGSAYDSLYDVPSQGSTLRRVHPGDRARSYLYAKLAAATFPDSVEISGAPMPNGLPPLTVDELELVRLWIINGAPRSGTINGTEDLVDGCLPEPEPIVIEPLEPPDPQEGVQFVMPAWPLSAQNEDEVCFATYYDMSGKIPEAFLSPDGRSFRFNVMELRQDPQSHHLLVHYPVNGELDPNDPAFGEWSCGGGPNDGQSCDPKNLTACGEDGICRTAVSSGPACIGWSAPSSARWTQIGGAQQAIARLPFTDGVYAEFPIRGVLRWNSHAFNLTNTDTSINGRLNYTFAQTQNSLVRRIFNSNDIFKSNAAPFTTQEVCSTHRLPRGSRLFNLTSHTHRRGKLFRVWTGDYTCDGGANDGEPCSPDSPDDVPAICASARCRDYRLVHVGDCDGNQVVKVNEVITGVRIALGESTVDACPNLDVDTSTAVEVNELILAVATALEGEPRQIDRDSASSLIYTSFQYDDPVYAEYDPPLAIDSDTRADRAMTFCSVYNNGVEGDGTPNVETVTRRSQTPPNSFGPCNAIACVNDGMVGESCRSDADCDSAPGAGDGFCDACRITGGVSTENEMFILIGLYWIE